MHPKTIVNVYCMLYIFLPSVLWRCWLSSRKGIRPVKNLVVGCWHGYLSGARCRLAYGPVDATVSCFGKIQIGFAFLVLAYLGSPGKGLLNGCVCVSRLQNNKVIDVDASFMAASTQLSMSNLETTMVAPQSIGDLLIVLQQCQLCHILDAERWWCCDTVLQSIIRNADTVTPKKKSRASCTPKKLLTPKSSRLRRHSPGGPYAVRTTNFVHIASLQLTKANLMKTNFSLDKVRSTMFSRPVLTVCCPCVIDVVEYLAKRMREAKLL